MALIDEFRKQTRETIMNYMDRLGVNHAVYSTHLMGYEPDLQEKNIIIYIHAKNMVVVCFDLCGNREEIADEGDTYDPMTWRCQNITRIRVLGRVLFVNCQMP